MFCELCRSVPMAGSTVDTYVAPKGLALDNIFVQRLWRSVKYEHVYLFPDDDGRECYRGLRKYFEYYNNEQRYQSQGDEALSTVYEQRKRKAA